MHIRDALIDASTGGRILEGSMQVALANSPLPLMPAHNQLLLTKVVGLTFSCVMQMERLSNSLCKTISLSTRLCLSVLRFRPTRRCCCRLPRQTSPSTGHSPECAAAHSSMRPIPSTSSCLIFSFHFWLKDWASS